MADHDEDSMKETTEHQSHEKRHHETKDEDFAEDEGKMHEDRQLDGQSDQDSLNLEEEKNKISIEEQEETIIRFCKENKCLYEDDFFPAGPPSLYNNPENIPEYDKNMGCEQ